MKKEYYYADGPEPFKISEKYEQKKDTLFHRINHKIKEIKFEMLDGPIINP
jgi:hypothetical protein